jgi:flavin-dependent dehydrogenase
MNRYDVVVVGARVAGASTAMLLARAGARVLLVDRGAPGSDTLSTHALMRAGVLQLSRWGLLDQVVGAGTPAVRRTLFHYGDEETVEVAIRSSAGVEALYAPRRHLLDAILVEAAVQAGVEVLHHTTVTGIRTSPAGRVTGVEIRDRHGLRRTVGAAMTIGADGVRSVVARQVGAPVVVAGTITGSSLYRYFTGIDAAGYEWAYGDHAGAGLIPTNDGATCVFVGAPPGRMRSLRRLAGVHGAFDSLLGDAAPRLADRVAGAEPVSRIHGWGGLPGHLRQSWGPGWALVGDAGYYKDPSTAHGMTDALRDAELLAGEVLEVLGAGVPEGVALARYQDTRDRLSRRLFDATEAVASYSWTLAEVRGLLRQVNSAMSDEVDLLAALPVSAQAPVLARDVHPDRGPMSPVA